MTTQEFSNEFDVLYNNITSNQAPGLDEYEKSVFLTKALNEILLSYFDPRSNKVQEGYDGSERRQIDFSMVTSSATQVNGFTLALYDPRDNSKSITILPTARILMILNERLVVTRDGKDVFLRVVPISYTEYDRLMSKPYKRPLKWQAWRIVNTSQHSMKFDLVVGPGDTIKGYAYRCVIRPTPIILTNLDGLTIDGESTLKDCILDPILHHEILLRAVELAKASYSGDLSSMITLGLASQTDMGFVLQAK